MDVNHDHNMYDNDCQLLTGENSTGISCVYDMRKNKPGLKAGAIESLGKRIGKAKLGLEAGCLILLRITNQCP